ncbi:DUF1090 domain-containing protein [Candidatus Symbiopectobacterium sp. NZEC151]|uniref:DUF1090 domain-containing protein n=1 Tax=Candidatus Symbiopectobacterium sp. NZEC151 TaxID=2820470 RepID=UPI002226F30A|nr:DUF1090 domain-containing protein [Candidatus Symbiopectobacterium sp. NZEC151]MCW2475336.1 DUF1090 domain-containing protein [Candidatus Symbiopectobacterium sp. NZEC151]
MKKVAVFRGFVIASLAFCTINAYAADAKVPPAGTCAAKAYDIEQQLAQARQHRNAGQIQGLETALRSVQTHCQDDDLRVKRQQNLAEKQAKVAEREAELRESQQSGADADKIQKRQGKLAEAQQDLRAAQQEITAAGGQ